MTLIEEISDAWRAEAPLDHLFHRLVVETKSRAAGCWRLHDGILSLIGFGWADDMPDEVSSGFQAATGSVSLDQKGFGIVQAAASRQPTIARRDPATTGLHRSASWIVKFDANTSLAVPIHDSTSQTMTGVLAVSTAAFVEPGDPLWQTMVDLTQEMGKSC